MIDIHDDLTGGDSFAMAYFPVRDGQHWLNLRHFGKNALRDIHVQVLLITSTQSPPKVVDVFSYPSLPLGQIEAVKPVTFTGDRLAFQIIFTAANIAWNETVKAVRKDGILIFALQTWRMVPEGPKIIVLREDVHPSFPRLPNGSVDWSFGTIEAAPANESANESADEMILRNLGMRLDPARPE